MDNIKSKNIIKIAITFLLILFFTVTFANVSHGTTQDGPHDELIGDGSGAKKSSANGCYGGSIKVEYSLQGKVNGTDVTGKSIDSYSKYLDMESCVEYSPKSELLDRGTLYKDGFVNGGPELWAKLASDTGVGTADDYKNGRIDTSQLHASIIFTINLYGQGGGHIGSHIVGTSLRLGYEWDGSKMVATPDLQAILDNPGEAYYGVDGNKIFGKGWLKYFAGKVSAVGFGEDGDDKDDDDSPHWEQYIVFEPSSNDWTNDPYYVYAYLRIPVHTTLDAYRVNLTLVNCTCHDNCKTSCTHYYAKICGNNNINTRCSHNSSHNTSQTTQRHYSDAHENKLKTKDAWKETKYLLDKNGNKVEDEETGEYITDGYVWHAAEYKYWCSPCEHSETDYSTLCSRSAHWGEVLEGTCSQCGQTTFKCYAYAHEHASKSGAKMWDWGVNHHEVTQMSCSGSSENTGVGTETARYKITNNGSHSASVTFSFYSTEIWDGTYTHSTLPRPVSNTYQSWKIPGDGHSGTLYASKTSGSYNFDSEKPSCTVTTTGYKGCGTKTYTSDATENITAWTNKSVKFSITPDDGYSGVDCNASCVDATTQEDQWLNEGEFKTAALHETFSSSSVVEFTYPDSGIYTIKIYIEDNAKRGGSCQYVSGRSSDDGVANSITVTYNVKIDKIPPTIQYALPQKTMLYNTDQNRFETSTAITDSSTNEVITPYFYIYASDNPNNAWHGITSELDTCKYYFTDDSTLNGLTAKEHGTEFSGDAWTKVQIPETYLKSKKYCYLLLYAKDKAGNESYTKSEIVLKDELTEKQIKNENTWAGPKDSDALIQTSPRLIKEGYVFINGPIDDPDNNGALQITRVYDVKWSANENDKTTISWSNRATSDTFAAYRNKQNDMIGLGYRVNFAYYVAGFGSDVGDTMTIYFQPYGKKGDTYSPLDIYLVGSDGSTYSKASDTSVYYKREYVSTGVFNNAISSAAAENNMGINETKWYQRTKRVSNSTVVLKDEYVAYFNYSIPATAKFKFKGTDTNYTGSEVVMKINIICKKNSDSSGRITNILTNDEYVKWSDVGTSKTFYGTRKTITFSDGTYAGQAFWYDTDSTALTDINGQKTY